MVGKYLCPNCGEEFQGPAEKGSWCPTCKIIEERGDAFVLTDPLLIVHRPPHLDGNYEVINADLSMKPAAMGILIADLIRHGARALQCSEAEIYSWVKREMRNQTGKAAFKGHRHMLTKGNA